LCLQPPTTHHFHSFAGIKCESIFKISEGRPNPADYLKNGEVTMMMITSGGDEPDLRDGKDLRRLALTLQVR
jgi:carbamoyl-phosphate synthase large subunit